MSISRIIQSFLFSILLVFLLFCRFWTGIFANYINYYGIQEFFNPFFGNVFSAKLFFVFVVGFGIAFLVPVICKIARIVYLVALFFCFGLLFPFFGKNVGEFVLAKDREVMIQGEKKEVYALYENRFYIVYLGDELNGEEDLAEMKKNLIFYEKPEA